MNRKPKNEEGLSLQLIFKSGVRQPLFDYIYDAVLRGGGRLNSNAAEVHLTAEGFGDSRTPKHSRCLNC